MTYRINKETVQQLADSYNYQLIDFQKSIGMVSYYRDGVRINIYLTKGTVSTSMNHPTKGKTQLFRKNITQQQLARIFKNPRLHTGQGYYKKQ
jgi:hypothetical protein